MAIYPVQYGQIPVDASGAFPAGRIANRPIIRLALLSEANRLDCYAIIDSGADHCVFPRSFMQPLGLDPLTAPIEGCFGVGDGGGVITHFSEIIIDLQGITQFEAFAGFTTGLEQWGVGLLGQTGFFDKFRIEFDLPNNEFRIEIPD